MAAKSKRRPGWHGLGVATLVHAQASLQQAVRVGCAPVGKVVHKLAKLLAVLCTFCWAGVLSLTEYARVRNA